MIISPPQAWSMLQRHADADVKSLRLAELRNHENEEEVGSFVAVHNSAVDGDDDGCGRLLILDWSRQRMTMETINHLLRLSAARRVRERIRDLAWGRLAPGGSELLRWRGDDCGPRDRRSTAAERDDACLSSPTVSFAGKLPRKAEAGVEEEEEEEEGGSMHLAFRAPASEGLVMRDPCRSETANALDEIHGEWKRIRSLSDSLRRGTSRGASGCPLCDVLVVSAGGTVVPFALEFVYRSLMLHDEEAEVASLVDSSLVSLNPASVGTAECDTMPPSKSGESMASTLQSTAGGVINMVTTPFKSARSRSNQDLQRGSASPCKPCKSSFRIRKLRVLTSIDPSAFKEVLTGLSPATTMVVTLSIDPQKDRECKEINLAVKNWLVSSGLTDASVTSGNKEAGINKQADAIMQKHMFLVTGKESLRKSNPNVFLLPRHSRCETFSTFSAAGLLPLSLVFGWNFLSSFLAGAHDIDDHFVDSNPRHNLPVILSLVDLWNDAFLHSQGRIIFPYSLSFGSYPGFVAAIENKVLNGSTAKGSSIGGKERPSSVIDGGSNALYDICLNRESNELSMEFIMTFDPPSSDPGISSEDILANHDSRMCSLLAHADTLAFGGSNGITNRARFNILSPGSPPMIQSVDSMLSHGSVNGGWDAAAMSGNQPSTLILCGSCDAFTCGQLIALAEHRAIVKAWLWDLDPFGTMKSTGEEEWHEYLSDKLYQMHHLISMGEDLDEADESSFPGRNGVDGTGNSDFGIGVHSATKNVLKNYATRMQRHRHHNMPRTPLRFGQNGSN